MCRMRISIRHRFSFSILLTLSLTIWACSGDDDHSLDDDVGFVDAGEDVDTAPSTDPDTAPGLDADATERSDADTDEPPSGDADGEPCEDDDDCLHQVCLSDDSWPGGHCTTSGCSEDSDCATDSESGDAICVDHPQEGAICVRSCLTGAEDACREGYDCQHHDSSGGWCAPTVETSGEISQGFSVSCTESNDGVATFDYDIDPSTTSYFLGITADNPGQITPDRIVLPDDSEIDFSQANHFQARPDFNQQSLVPLQIPASPAFEDQLQSGSHTVEVATSLESPCLTVIEDQESEHIIDLNIYLVGLNAFDLTPTTAGSHEDFQTVLTELGDILAQVDIGIGEIRYPALPTDVIEQYRILQHEDDLPELIAYSEPPGEGEGDHLSLNIFMPQAILYGVLGTSMGAPGMAGVHGGWFSGVGVTGEYIGDGDDDWGNRATALAMAHEIGHFLGLVHTSELDGQTFDYLDDTDQCTDLDPDDLSDCPDWGNLMFFAADLENQALTDDQGFVMQTNPLTK